MDKVERTDSVTSQVPISHNPKLFLWGHLKSIVYVNKMRNTDKMKDMISECVNINDTAKSSGLLLALVQKCIQAEGNNLNIYYVIVYLN
jgi:hypothetical protein